MRQSDKNNKKEYDDINVLDKLQKELEETLKKDNVDNVRCKDILQSQANIIYNNKTNSGHLIKMENQQKVMMDLMDKVKDKETMDAVSNLGSSLAYKNKENKEIMQKNELMRHVKQMMDNNDKDLNNA